MATVDFGKNARLFGPNEALLFFPGCCFAFSNFILHSEAMGGVGDLWRATNGFLLLMGAFGLAAAAPISARRLRRPPFANRPIGRACGHLAIAIVGAPLQFLAIAAAITIYRDQSFSLGAILDRQAASLSECWPAWVAVYAFLVALDSRLEAAERDRIARSLPAREKPAATCRLQFHVDGVDHFVSPTDIKRVRSMGDYVEVHFSNRRLIVKSTLAEIERSLSDYGFIRVHRTALVTSDSIATIERRGTGAFEITLYDGEKVPLSRRRISEVRATLEARR